MLWGIRLYEKSTICSVVRIVEMTIALIVMREVYQIGCLGYLLVGLTGLVWSVTTDIERTNK